MKVNFEIDLGAALNYNGRCIDLHNNFDFVGLEYKIEAFTLILRWTKSTGSWVQADELAGLTLIHKDVNYLSVTPRDPEMPLTEDNCLMDVTFFSSSHREMNDSIVEQRLPNNDDDILYNFESGQNIRVNCREIELLIHS